MGAAAFVMIISCANVANLTLMRGIRREHELVVRAALGAGVARLRRLLLAENLTLAFAGALLGLVLDREALHLSLRAFYSGDAALRGTAMEYLENVVPDEMREGLFSCLGDRRSVARHAPRPHLVVVEELQRTMGSRKSPSS